MSIADFDDGSWLIGGADAPGGVVISGNAVTVDDQPPNEEIYVYKDYTAGFFNRDTRHRFKMLVRESISGTVNETFLVYSMFDATGNAPGAYAETVNDPGVTIAVSDYQSTGGDTFRCYISNNPSGAGAVSTAINLVVGTTYYVTVTRNVESHKAEVIFATGSYDGPVVTSASQFASSSPACQYLQLYATRNEDQVGDNHVTITDFDDGVVEGVPTGEHVNISIIGEILHAARSNRAFLIGHGDSTMTNSGGDTPGLGGILNGWSNALHDVGVLDTPLNVWGYGPFCRPQGSVDVVPWIDGATKTSPIESGSAGDGMPAHINNWNVPDTQPAGSPPINGGYVYIASTDFANWNHHAGWQLYAVADMHAAWPLPAERMRCHFTVSELAAAQQPGDDEGRVTFRLKEGSLSNNIETFFVDGVEYDADSAGFQTTDKGADGWVDGYIESPADHWDFDAAQQITFRGRNSGVSQSEDDGIRGIAAWKDFFIEFPDVASGICHVPHYSAGGATSADCEADFAAYTSVTTEYYYRFYEVCNRIAPNAYYIISLALGQNDADGTVPKWEYKENLNAIMDRIVTMMASIGIPTSRYKFLLASPHDKATDANHGHRDADNELAFERNDCAHYNTALDVTEAQIALVEGFGSVNKTDWNPHRRIAGDKLIAETMMPIIEASYVPPSGSTPSGDLAEIVGAGILD